MQIKNRQHNNSLRFLIYKIQNIFNTFYFRKFFYKLENIRIINATKNLFNFSLSF
jgi:hypothetical protein